MIAHVALPHRFFEKLICMVGALVLTAMMFPPDEPPPVFPLYIRRTEQEDT